MPSQTPYLDRTLIAAMKRRLVDTVALPALLKATELLGLVLAERLRRYREMDDPVLDRFAQLQEQALHAQLFREAVEILASRWDKIPERRRPHYSPEARFRIIRIKALLALSAEEAARLFRLSQATVHRWTQEATAYPQRDTVGSLVNPVPPVRRYADVVRHLVQAMVLSGFPGSQTVAQALGRVGWTLSRRTVQRIRAEKLPAPPPEAPQRHVRARYPHHVWMADLTEVPGLFRLFSFKVAVVLDVFSRLPLASRVFTKEPSATQMLALVEDATYTHGRPRHFVSDQGAQFTATAFRDTLVALGIRQRFGAIGKTGSIAIIERFWRSLKDALRLRSLPPLLRIDLERRLGAFLSYYSCLRPHQGLGGATPVQVFSGVVPARPAPPSPPPRGRPGQGPSASPFQIAYLDPERRLPFLIKNAA